MICDKTAQQRDKLPKEGKTHGFKLSVTCRSWRRPRIESDSTEEVVCAQANGKREEKVRKGVRLSFWKRSLVSVMHTKDRSHTEQLAPFLSAMIGQRTVNESRDPAVHDPDYGSHDDACKIWALVDVIHVGRTVEQDMGDDLREDVGVNFSADSTEQGHTWGMPMNSAMARMMPVYQGNMVSVEKMRKKNSVGRTKITILVLL
jgi:hypothetical protein